MHQVINLAKIAVSKGEEPFAAFLVNEKGETIFKTHNIQNSTNDRTAHAEVNLIRQASIILKKHHFNEYSIFSISEPCSMCTSLLVKSRVKAIYYGMPLDHHNDPYITAAEIIGKSKHQPMIYGGLLEEECSKIIATVRDIK